MDVFSKRKRSEVMRKIRSKDTKPEMQVRRALHRLGYRFRLHDPRLPGKPDLVLAKYRTAIQVRGCFWHGHDCKVGHTPRTNTGYWRPKIQRNIERDLQNDAQLHDAGWNVIVVWECACRKKPSFEKDVARIVAKLKKALEKDQASA